jgi:phosphoribosylformylglycinamidine synthase
LFTSITDCGAGGLSSAIGEMGQSIGAVVELDKVPLKYAGLRYDEIWISEAQERMVVAVPQEKVLELLELCRGEDVEATVIGEFGTPHRELILNYQGTEVGRMTMRFVHDGIPMPTRKAFVPAPRPEKAHGSAVGLESMRDQLLALLANPNIASKHWIIRQYDHEVQGGSVIKPLTGPIQIGPSDAAVIRPKLSSTKGVALSCGLAPQIEDPYAMTIAAIDEAIRNAVAVGADPSRMAILDNFCWPSVDDEATMGTLVAACEACRAAALAYGVPFISGKDSLHNQFTNQETKEVIRIPRTLLISAIGVVNDVRKCVTMDLKDAAEGRLCLIAPKSANLPALATVHRAVAEAIGRGWLLSCHDISEGGALVAAAEMCIASGLGLNIQCDEPFNESNARYLVEIHSHRISDVEKLMSLRGVSIRILGSVSSDQNLIINTDYHVAIDELTRAWRGTLDW